MNKYLYIYIPFLIFFISCKEKKQDIQIKEKIKSVNIMNIRVRDVFTEILDDLQNKYNLKINNKKKTFDKTLNFFVNRNKSYFDDLTSEREAIYENKDTKVKIYVREWTFSKLPITKEIEKIINKPNYEDKSDGVKLVIDTIKEPHFTYRVENKLYVFYVQSVNKAHYVNFFRNIINKLVYTTHQSKPCYTQSTFKTSCPL